MFFLKRWRIVPEEEELEQLVVEEEKCLEAGELVEEDVSEDTMTVIHEKAQMDERKKFETYLKFPLTSRSRANRRTDSRGNESSGANTPTPDATSPAPHQHVDTEVSKELCSHGSFIFKQVVISVNSIATGWPNASRYTLNNR